jgi:short-subunit dehydrogenase
MSNTRGTTRGSEDAPLVLITGASSGLGEALAIQYAKAGWRLALVARRLEVLESLQGQLVALGTAPNVRLYSADVQDLQAMIDVAKRCVGELGVPDVVIANAGVSVGVDLQDARDVAVLRDTLAVNVMGVANTFHPFIGPMRAQRRGKLVSVASVAAIRGLPGHAAYCASKSAVVALSESLRGDLRGSGVHVVTILPGFVATPLTRGNRYAMPFLMQPDAFAAKAQAAIQAGRTYCVIPWQMGWVARLLRLLPNGLFDRLMAGRARKRRRHED